MIELSKKQFAWLSFCLICLMHVGLVLFVSHSSSPSRIPDTENTITLEMIDLDNINLSKASEHIEKETSTPQKPPEKTLNDLSTQHPQQRTAPKVSETPEEAARADRISDEALKLAVEQRMIAAQSNNEPQLASVTPTSFAQGNTTETLSRSQTGSRFGTASENTASIQGEDNPGSVNSGISQQARHVFINRSYPESLQNRGIEGAVLVRVIVSENGKAKEVSVIKSAHPALVLIAEKAARNGRYRAAQKNGQAIESTIEFNITYKITEET